MQLHARSPFDVRRLYRKAHPLIPKALGIFGSAAVRLWRQTEEPRFAAVADDALGLLCADNSSRGGWGYHWDMQTRWSFYAAGSPNVVVTAFAAAGLAEAARALGNESYAHRASAAAKWMIEQLFLSQGFFAYHPASAALIHNANLLGASTVWRLLPQDETVTSAVSSAVQRTLAAQAPDGSWPYGDAPNLGFVDSFHTGYVLANLCRLEEAHPSVPAAIARGVDYYSENFFDGHGRAVLWPNKRFPEDGHSAGTALTTLATLYRNGYVGVEPLQRVGRRVVEGMLQDGHATFRRYRWGPARVRYVRWCDAHVALGLADAALALSGRPAPD